MRVWWCASVVMHNKLIGLVVTSFFVAVPAAECRRDNQYLIPPPPPSAPLMVPPPPVALPYSEAYANYKVPTQEMPAPTLVSASRPVRMPPNLTGLSLVEAQARGFGKPRVPYNAGFGPGAALAMPYTSAPAMNTWFDSSLRWYSSHLSASQYYDAMAAQAPYFKPDAPSHVVARQRVVRAKFKRIIATR